MLSENLQSVRQRMRQACERSGRDASSVTLVGVTKGITVPTIREAIALGVIDIGENRVQEARDKRLAVESWLGAQGSGLGVVARSPQPSAQSALQLQWHLIGHVQRNKAKYAVELFDVIHSVDSVSLVDELERQVEKRAQGSGLRAQGKSVGKPLEVFVQVNVSGERTKFGCLSNEAPGVVRAILQRPHLSLKGLMTIAPFAEDHEHARPHFRRLRELRDELVVSLSPQPPALSLSMGMSQDFEVAIEEGADLVRVGTAIFGDRRQETGDMRPG